MANLIFDYFILGEKLSIPIEIVQKFEKEAHNEFPFDRMLMEIHILRALKAYSRSMTRMVVIEN